MNITKWVSSLVLAVYFVPCLGQIVNSYASVAALNGAQVSLASVDEGGDTFEDGEEVIILQVQDDVLGPNINDNASFGMLSAISNAGTFEIRTIVSHVETPAGTPSELTLDAALPATFNLGANSSIQVISYPSLGNPDFTTTANLTSLPWNGDLGGVLAFRVSGTLNLDHSLIVDGQGFRGAAANQGGATGCSGNTNFRLPTNNNHANKGEGIYRASNTNQQAGMGRIANGGGGGNSHNGGGGGGSGFTVGGQGGEGWPNCNPSAGGFGGEALGAFYNNRRLFLGGGGGAGQANNGFGRMGGHGGGIIIVQAGSVVTQTCSGVEISADGQSVTQGSGNDGNSGGGGGGAILLDVGTWNIGLGCPLTFSASGGNGGDVVHGGFHGGGGGGGLGYIGFLNPAPTNATYTNNPGQGGFNCTNCSRAETGGGVDGDGIFDNQGGTLPVSYRDFWLEAVAQGVALHWETLQEINSSHFVMEHWGGGRWKKLGELAATGSPSQSQKYIWTDLHPLWGQQNTYRLTEVSRDGVHARPIQGTIYLPEPAAKTNLRLWSADLVSWKAEIRAQGNWQLRVVGIEGKELHRMEDRDSQSVDLPLIGYASGWYLVELQAQGQRRCEKLWLNQP